MAKYDLIISDPPWEFSDGLTMADTPRGAAANYSILDIEAIKGLEVSKLAKDNSILVLWVPSSMLQEGLDTMKSWKFEQKQTFIWVKVKQTKGLTDPLKGLHKQIRKFIKKECKKDIFKASECLEGVKKLFDEFDINDILSLYMGHLFRQTHEIALIGTKGSVYGQLAVKNQRSVLLDRNFGHSAKPEGLQDRLDIMFPTFRKLEIFARRERDGWETVGLECPSTPNEDIRDSIKRLQKEP